MSLQALLAISILTFITGFADAQGFVHASAIWDSGRFDPSTALKATCYFMLGIPAYILTLYWLRRQGVIAAELQLFFWFTVTVIGVALLSGRLATWSPVDRTVAGLVTIGMIWLMIRVGG